MDGPWKSVTFEGKVWNSTTTIEKTGTGGFRQRTCPGMIYIRCSETNGQNCACSWFQPVEEIVGGGAVGCNAKVKKILGLRNPIEMGE